MGVDVHNPIPPEAEFYLDEYDAERFWGSVDFRGGTAYRSDSLATAIGECWIWTGGRTGAGYGTFRLGDRFVAAHRIAFKDFGGKLPDDLPLDHLCRVHECVRPSHVEPVTQAVNVERGINGNRATCKNGHPYTAENTRIERRKTGPIRICRNCRKAQRRKVA